MSSVWSKSLGDGPSVSRAVLVDGGLTPPPSRLYPGTKCYMVTVAMDGREHFGFGPTPSIARTAAIREATKFNGQGKLVTRYRC